ncbi:hypothetical protein CDAR_65311 [Caerostris darwini]|uniref:Uncharacterized protein n=1 Tax=Caerostris darwini TaxID=1538125 RepID=A0AAV4R349_9ARAC|nr:hypothetical protein CDAR_65311 [Caerostris darwini]
MRYKEKKSPRIFIHKKEKENLSKMTKRFQTETLRSEFLLRRANIYGIVCKSLRCNITRFNSLQAIPSSTPLPHPLPHPAQNEYFTFTVFLSAPQQFIRLRSETKVFFRAP